MSKGRVRSDGSARARYRRGGGAEAEVERLKPMFVPLRSITVDFWKAWYWAWSCIGKEYAARVELDWPLPHTFFAQRRKTLPNPFVRSDPSEPAEVSIDTPLVRYGGGIPDGTSARVNDGKTHFVAVRAVEETLIAARDAIQRLLLLGDFGNFDDQRAAWERVVEARWVLARPPQKPADGVGWPMPELAWRAALDRNRDGTFAYRTWEEAERELQKRVAHDVSDEILGKVKGLSRQAIAKKRARANRKRAR